MRLYKVLNTDLLSPFQSFQFEIGKEYICDDFDESDVKCSSGFYATDFNGLVYSLNKDGDCHAVYEVEVSGRQKEFDQFKRRYEKIKIIRELSKEEIIAGLEVCRESEGYNTVEACYPVYPFDIEPTITIDEAVELLKQWASVWDSVWASVRDSVWASVRASVWDSVWASVRASAWGYTSSLFPGITNWKYVEHEPGVNPFQSDINLWMSGYVPSYDGKIWRLHTRDGIVWVGEISNKEVE
jgi:hypothetical protein